MGYGGYYGFASYVSVAKRRRKAEKKIAQLRKKGMKIEPIQIEGRAIAKTFWGKAWCDHIEGLGDFENRLPRGRTYVRNGSVCHLEMKKGQIKAIVSGSSLYKVEVKIKPLVVAKWGRIKTRCGGQIGSLIELLQGRLSDNVMQVVTHSDEGMFPLEKEIEFSCSCPDWASMCKHVAAVLYGIGSRLDHQPELLFVLRGVKHEELIDTSAARAIDGATKIRRKRRTVAESDLADVFGIEVDSESEPVEMQKTTTKGRRPRAKAAVFTVDKTKRKSAAVTKNPLAKKSPRKPAASKSAKKKSTAKPKQTPAKIPKA